MPRPLAYHITWGTYGTRLPGGPRITVDRKQNQYKTPVLGPDIFRQKRAEHQLKFAPIHLTLAQRRFIETAIPAICLRGSWILHAAACQSDHVHVLLSSSSDPKIIRRCLKRWLTEDFVGDWPLTDGQSLWAEGGSIKWVMQRRYFEAVLEYVGRQSIQPEPGRGRPGSPR